MIQHVTHAIGVQNSWTGSVIGCEMLTETQVYVPRLTVRFATGRVITVVVVANRLQFNVTSVIVIVDLRQTALKLCNNSNSLSQSPTHTVFVYMLSTLILLSVIHTSMQRVAAGIHKCISLMKDASTLQGVTECRV